jgi:5-formyltetrahydrofolate cyclo-ligase
MNNQAVAGGAGRPGTDHDELWLKKEFRRQGLLARRALSEPVRQWKSRKIGEKVLSCPDFSSCRSVCLYSSLPEEVDTAALIAAFLNQGAAVALPSHSEGLVLRLIKDPKMDLVPSKSFRLKEPKPSCKSVNPKEVETFLLPGVAFDRTGRRIGFGGGFFDRILAEKNPSARTAALSFQEQVFPCIPALIHDQSLQRVFTDSVIFSHQVSSVFASNLKATRKIAQKLADRLRQTTFRFGLVGPMGAGKTAFIQELASALGAKEPAGSPSFVLQNEYDGPTPVRHIDLYRLGDRVPGEEDLQMFLETVTEFEGGVLIEWADYGRNWLPLEMPEIHVEYGDDKESRIIRLMTYQEKDLELHEVFQ